MTAKKFQVNYASNDQVNTRKRIYVTAVNETEAVSKAKSELNARGYIAGFTIFSAKQL